MDKIEFEKLVSEAISAVPSHIQKAIDNVVFVVENRSSNQKKGEMNIATNEMLLGLYEGVPQIRRGSGYTGALPDKITLFQEPLEELSGGDEDKLKKLIREVVEHEIGHYFGFDEEEIRAIEQKRKKLNKSK